jgi:K(+)-stimulated pyrophosphate-energized sodium pump
MLDVAEVIFQTCKTYLIQQGKFLLMLFAIIAVVQFIRAVGGWQIVVNGTTSVPVWASWIACVVIAGLAWVGFDASRRS